MKIKIIYLFLIPLIATCGERKSRKVEGPSFNQNFIYGQKVYVQHCQNCHGEKGEGFASLYPPLAASDFLLEDINRSICIARYGYNETIKVNGKEFSLEMPVNDELNPAMIADVMTFILNSWGNKKGIVTEEQVSVQLDHCSNKR